CHCRPDVELAFDLERSAVQLDRRFCKRQTEPSSLVLAVEHRVDAVKGLLNERDVLGADPDTGVADPYAQRAGVGLARYRHTPARRGELDRITDQVHEHLL